MKKFFLLYNLLESLVPTMDASGSLDFVEAMAKLALDDPPGDISTGSCFEVATCTTIPLDVDMVARLQSSAYKCILDLKHIRRSLDSPPSSLKSLINQFQKAASAAEQLEQLLDEAPTNNDMVEPLRLLPRNRLFKIIYDFEVMGSRLGGISAQLRVGKPSPAVYKLEHLIHPQEFEYYIDIVSKHHDGICSAYSAWRR